MVDKRFHIECQYERLTTLLNPTTARKMAANTPKALTNFSPGLERSDNPGNHTFKMRKP